MSCQRWAKCVNSVSSPKSSVSVSISNGERLFMPTNPGYHPDVELASYPAALRSAISNIAKNFYVTRSFQPFSIGNSTYWALLIRPTDEFSVYINTDREVVCVFSTYENLEIRTLEAFDAVYDLLETKRVDRSVRFLVSSDPKVEGIVKHYLDQHPEYPIIVPYNLDNLSFTKSNHLLDAIRRNYIIRDLFGYQNPLREETFFFGRTDIVNHVLDSARSGQNSTIFGLRKSGKTSSIYAIMRKAKAFNSVPVQIDCQNPNVHGRSFDKLLSYIITQTRKSIGQSGQESNLGETLPEVSENFYQLMRSSLGGAKSNILLIFDEIENISPLTAASDHWRSGRDPVLFWQVLRSFIQSDAKGRLAVCIVGTSPHILEQAKINGIDNPIYLFAPKRFMPSLSFSETKEMVQRLGYFMGLDFSDGLVALLHSAFGGHPFFTRQVCSLVHRQAAMNRPVIVSESALTSAIESFSGDLENYISAILDHLNSNYPEEFSLLRSIVRGDQVEALEYMAEAPDLIDHLVGYELITKVGDEIEIKFKSIGKVLEKLFPTDSSTPEARWIEVMTRRNLLEQKMRTTFFFESKRFSSIEWTEILSASMTNKRFSDLDNTAPELLFSHDRSPLYFGDLIGIFSNNRIMLYLDEKQNVKTSLHTINKLRKDAHALSIDDEAMAEVRKAFELAEQTFFVPGA